MSPVTDILYPVKAISEEKIQFVTLGLPLPVMMTRNRIGKAELDFQANFMELLDFRLASQDPTDHDLKPKLRYHFPG
jgi:hypothetical protein